MNKTQLRRHLRKLRHDLSETERHTLSQHICHQLEAMDWSGIHTVHCFEPITELEEVDITAFITWFRTHYSQIQVYTSRHIADVWEIVSWHDHTATHALQFDAVIVPMLGFDNRLHRVGYGGGYYDEFLATQQHTRKIGVCFELGRVAHIPVEPHDILLDIIVTEASIYSIT